MTYFVPASDILIFVTYISRFGVGHHHEDASVFGITDPNLATVDDVIGSVLHRLCLQCEGVGAAISF